MKVFVPKALDKEGINLIPAFSSHVPEIIPMMEDFYKMFEYDFDEERATSVIRDLIKDQKIGRLWLIREEEELIGYVALIFSYSLGYGRTGLLDEFYLVESHRSKGIGREIIEKVLNEAKKCSLHVSLLFILL